MVWEEEPGTGSREGEQFLSLCLRFSHLDPRSQLSQLTPLALVCETCKDTEHSRQELGLIQIFTCCVSLGKSLSLSEPISSSRNWVKWEYNSIWLTGRPGGNAVYLPDISCIPNKESPLPQPFMELMVTMVVTQPTMPALPCGYGNGMLAVKSTDGSAVEHGAGRGELRGVPLLPLTLVSTFM